MKGFIRRSAAAGLLASCLLPSIAQAQAAAVQLDFVADLQADGVLVNIVPDASLAPALQALVSKRVATWRYRMGNWQGVPIPSKISQRILADAVPVATGGYALRIREVAQPSRTIDPSAAQATHKMPPPKYPLEMQRRGVSATVAFAMRAGPQGKPVDMELVFPAKPTREEALFVAAAREAIEQWTLSPVMVAGVPADCRQIIPMTFTVDGTAPLPADTTAYRASHPDTCPAAPVLVTKVDGTLL